ncbi:MAG: peroxidase-related enzyme [Streptosporangiaceae bacterium]
MPLVAEGDATGHLAELFDLVKVATGLPFVPDVFRLASTRPDLVEVVVSGYGGVFLGGVLPRETKELIAAWTSKLNGCTYCLSAHNYFLKELGVGADLPEAVGTATTIEELPLPEKTRVLLRLTAKVATGAHRITDADWDRAVEAGWSSEELLEAVFCSALFNFVNGLVDALGLRNAVQEA